MSKPTYEDAQIMLQLARWGAESKINKAYGFLWSDAYIEDFEAFRQKYPQGSKENTYITLICGWFETLAALWVNGLFNQQLIRDWIAVSAVWNRVKGFALGSREQSGNPAIFEHFEALAKALSE